MNYPEILARLKNRKLLTAIVIVIILSSIYIWYHIEESEPLEFTIKLVESPYDITNKTIYYQLKNIDDKAFYYLDPEIGKNLDFIIKAKNGTEYHYAGPITYGGLFWDSLLPGEIENGTQLFGYRMDYSYWISNYTIWQNSDTEEYWFFQPGTYKIYGKYESKPNNNYENVLVGIWYSNAVTLKIE
jgi:hypothetical protein